MKTTIDIPEGVLEEAIKHSNVTTKRDAVVLALTEFNKRKRLEGLAAMMGQSDTFMTHEELVADREASKNRTYE